MLKVKGDFDALLNADSGKPATTKQPPVLLDLRKSGSFKPQSSQDSAASFATAPSTSSDVVSEAAGPTHSSSTLGSVSAGRSSPLKAGPPVADPSAGDQLLQKHSSNGAAERSTAAGSSEAGATETPAELASAAEDKQFDSRGTAEMQSSEQKPNSIPALNGSTSDGQPVRADDDPLGLQRGQRTDSLAHDDSLSPDLSQHAAIAESRSLVETASMPQQESSVQDAQAEKGQIAGNGEERQRSAAALLESLSASTTTQQSEAQDSASAGDSHPLEPRLPDTMVTGPVPSGAQKQDTHEDSATLHDPLQNKNHETFSSNTAGDLEPQSDAAASQGQTTISNSQLSMSQDSRYDIGFQTESETARKHDSTMMPEQAPPTASQERSASARNSAAPGSGQPEKAPAQDRAAEPGERFEDAQGQLSFSCGPEASEELPVSTLGARWLSGVLPDQESSAAGDSPAADAEAAAHGEGSAEPDEDLAREQQGTVSLPCEALPLRSPTVAVQCC